eukprot:m.48551 g.48551  ORF g.48551 m.48551 type:complete len:286 (+) comp47749_c0_seq4:18-875(+)
MAHSLLLSVLACTATVLAALNPSTGWFLVKDGKSRVDACIAVGGDTWQAFGDEYFRDYLLSADRAAFLENLGISSCQRAKLLAHWDENALATIPAGFTDSTVPLAIVCCSSHNCQAPYFQLSNDFPLIPTGSWRVSLVSAGSAADSVLYLSLSTPQMPNCRPSLYFVSQCTKTSQDESMAVTVHAGPMGQYNQMLIITGGNTGSVFYIYAERVASIPTMADAKALVSITAPNGVITYIKLSDVLPCRPIQWVASGASAASVASRLAADSPHKALLLAMERLREWT